MREITEEEYKRFLETHDTVSIEGKQIPLLGYRRVKKVQPDDFKLETTTLWSFPKRGDWATHKANYRGNWAPQIPRNLILRYTSPDEVVLDMMVGGGTTPVECKLLGRRGMGVDINLDALMLTKDRLNFYSNSMFEELPEVEIGLYQGDARKLDLIDDNSVDLIATHPPYANIIKYSKSSKEVVDGDLSKIKGVEHFVKEMFKVAIEAHRVLKPGRYCGILVGDTRRNRHYVSIAFRVMQAFLEAGFILKEDVIKYQWHTQTESLWTRMSRDKNFLLMMHEHLFVFRKWHLPRQRTRSSLYSPLC